MNTVHARRRKPKNVSRRYAEIISVLVKYGLGELSSFTGLHRRLVPGQRKPSERLVKSVASYTRWERIRLAIEELGPSFIKFGQMLSSRRDMLPGELIDELEKLQDSVPPFPSAQAMRIVAEDLHRPVMEVFSSFDETPAASASIAQVHRAVLKDGTTAAVKIARPGIEEKIAADIVIMYRLARLFERHSKNLYLRPVELVREFERQISTEMEFGNEVLNMKRFAYNFHGRPEIVVPKPFRTLCTRRVIIMEYIRGTKLLDIISGRATGFDRKLLAERGIDLLLCQIFIHGFFHADPHPGNFLVLPDNVICFLDFGMMGTVPPRDLGLMTSAVLGLVKRDPRLIAKAILPYARTEEPGLPARLESAVYTRMERYIDLPLAEIDLIRAMQDLLDLVIRFRIEVPSNFLMMAKTLGTIEGVSRQLDPEIRIIERIERFSSEFVSKRYGPSGITGELASAALEYGELLRDLPESLRRISGVVQNRRLGVEFELDGLERFRETVDKVGSRLVFGLVLASLLVSSSLMVISDIRPKWNDIPMIGLVGFLLGGVMGVTFLLLELSRILRMRSWRKHEEHPPSP